MMTKPELVKILSKKAAVSESSAKELFDLFLQKIAEELHPGESAKFSNVGYFHYRKGKIKTDNAETDKVEYLDLIIFSSSVDLNIKSSDNLVFSVPETRNSEQDDLDAHFSLSVGKPVLSRLEGKNSTEAETYLPDEIGGMLNRKVESLMVNLEKEEISKSDEDLLLVDIKKIDEDQLELELDEDAKKKNSSKIPESTIHSSEKLKSLAWDFGKDLSRQIKEESIPDVENKEVNKKSDTNFANWDFGKRYWSAPPASVSNGKIELDQTTKKVEKIEKIKENDDNKTVEEEKSVEDIIDEIDAEDFEIEMNDFQISDTEEKFGKFERVRSISSSLDEDKPLEEVKKFESFLENNVNKEDNSIDYDKEFKKITSKADQFRTSETKKFIDDKKVSVKEKKVKTDLKLNRAEAVKRRKMDYRKSSAGKFIVIAAIFIIIIGVFYLLMKDSGKVEVVEENVPPIERKESATYIERSFEIPVTYPYSKPESENKLVGFISSEIKNEAPEKKTEIKKPEKKPEVKKTESTVIKTKPPVKKTEERKTVTFQVGKPSGTPKQAAYNIYRYNNIFIVQVAAFRNKTTAEKEASKYVAKGYNGFIEEAIIDGVTWYRVRVGNFNTLEKAKNFRKSN